MESLCYSGCIPCYNKEKGYVIHGGEPLADLGEGFVKPAIVEVPEQCDVVKTETFAPYVVVEASSGSDIALDISNTMTFRNIAPMTLDLVKRLTEQTVEVHLNALTTLNTLTT